MVSFLLPSFSYLSIFARKRALTVLLVESSKLFLGTWRRNLLSPLLGTILGNLLALHLLGKRELMGSFSTKKPLIRIDEPATELYAVLRSV